MALTKVTSGLTDLDGGITVDNITIDGTEIDLSSGSLTVDAAQNIILDHDSGHSLVLQGSATSYGSFFINNSTNLAIATAISNGGIEFFANGSERMRIDSAGNFLLNTTDKTGGGQLGTSRLCLKINGAADNGILVHDTRTSSGTDNALVFVRGSSTVGTIQTSTSATAFNTSSDYRLKENIQPMKNGLERLNKLKPSKFNWKETGESSEGFIAHEIQEAGWLEGVSGNKDDEQMQMVDYGKITPLLVKAIQELSAKVEELESKINE